MSLSSAGSPRTSPPFYARSNPVTVFCIQSFPHLQGEPGRHRRAHRRHAADPEHSRGQAAPDRRGVRRQQRRKDRHRWRHQSKSDRYIYLRSDQSCILYVYNFYMNVDKTQLDLFLCGHLVTDSYSPMRSLIHFLLKCILEQYTATCDSIRNP